jgi:hypothetical protein
MKVERHYPVMDGTGQPPDYQRAVAALSLQEIRDEIALGRGEAGFQAALRRALAMRTGRTNAKQS